MTWEEIESDLCTILRAKVPGGWLVLLSGSIGGGAMFYPDPEHKWRAN